MGYEYGDAQNIAVRCFFNQFSKQFKYFDNFYRQKTLEYFDNRCPYTGIKLTYNNSERDHIIPFNSFINTNLSPQAFSQITVSNL